MVVQSDTGTSDDAHGSFRHVNSSLDSALRHDDSETVKGFSDDGHSYAGTIVLGVLLGEGNLIVGIWPFWRSQSASRILLFSQI